MAARASLPAVAFGVLLCLLTTAFTCAAPAVLAVPAGAAVKAADNGTTLHGRVQGRDLTVGPHTISRGSSVLSLWKAIDYIIFEVAPVVARQLAGRVARFINYDWQPPSVAPEDFSFAKTAMREILSMTGDVCHVSSPIRLATRAPSKVKRQAGLPMQPKHLPCLKEQRFCRLRDDRAACYRCVLVCLRIHKNADGCGRLDTIQVHLMQSCVSYVLRNP